MAWWLLCKASCESNILILSFLSTSTPSLPFRIPLSCRCQPWQIRKSVDILSMWPKTRQFLITLLLSGLPLAVLLRPFWTTTIHHPNQNPSSHSMPFHFSSNTLSVCAAIKTPWIRTTSKLFPISSSVHFPYLIVWYLAFDFTFRYMWISTEYIQSHSWSFLLWYFSLLVPCFLVLLLLWFLMFPLMFCALSRVRSVSTTRRWRTWSVSRSRPSSGWSRSTPTGCATRPSASRLSRTRSCPSTRTCSRTVRKR